MRVCLLRRAPGSRFVPPVRREEGEGGSSVDVVRGRVQCPSGDGSGRRLPPELEGDERLRNIEPRMVELITNEVCVYVLTFVFYFVRACVCFR